MLRIALVILLGALTACKSPVRAAPAPDPLPSTLASGPAVDGPHGKTTTVMLAGGWIEVTLTVPESGAAPFPVVISPILPDDELLTHGFALVRFRTNWESLRVFAKPAVEATPRPEEAEAKPAETKPAAEPVGKWLLTAKRPGIVGRFYFDLITVDAEQSLPAVIDWLETRDDIDVRRIAVTGSSTGGFKALQAMAIEPRIAVGVVRVACGDYLTFLKSSSLALNDDPRWLPGGKLVLDPDYAVEIAAREPIRHADRYPPRPLLLLAGERDPAIPFACVENTVSRFRTAYAKDDASDRFRFVPFAEEGHNLSSAANAEILPWLERWLSHDISAAAR